MGVPARPSIKRLKASTKGSRARAIQAHFPLMWSCIKWTLEEKKRNPHVCAISRVQAVGGDPSELERAIDSDYVIIAPTVGVQGGHSNPIVRARE